jgi:hypothetical protein
MKMKKMDEKSKILKMKIEKNLKNKILILKNTWHFWISLEPTI